MIINAKNTILGRIASVAAKQALLGETVSIVNAEQAIVTGEKQAVLANYRRKYARGVPSKGPHISRLPDRLVRRAVRGMLPYKQSRGRDAYKRVLAYVGVPDEFKNKELVVLDANVSKLPNTKYVSIQIISNNLGGKK